MASARSIALVNGGTGDIGKSVVKKFLNSGWNVVVGTRNVSKASEALEPLKNDPRSWLKIVEVCSSSMEAAASSMARVEEAVSQEPISVFVNAAGAVSQSLLVRLSEEQLITCIESNLTQAIRINKVVAKSFLKNSGRGEGNSSILNIGSVVASQGNVGQVAYSASKAGLLGLTKSLAKEVGKRNIRVNLIEPGLIESRMVRDSMSSKVDITNNILLQRLGTTEEVANLAYFLSSPEASYITSQVIRVDGGINII